MGTDAHAFDEPRFEDSLRDDTPIRDESRLIRDVFDLYEMLERNAAYAVRTAEAEAERNEILREIAELEALVA